MTIVLLIWSGASSAAASPKQLKIVATTGMLADLVRNIAGTSAAVSGLMGSGVDPHLYKPTRSDIALLTSADLAIYNGLLLEGGMTASFDRLKSAGRKVLAVAEEAVKGEALLAPPGFAYHYDPHVWMDPLIWSKVALKVKDTLCELDPGNAELYSQNGEAYLKKLDELHEYSQEILQSVPSTSRVLITAHDAFNYFGRRYQFEVEGIQGISTESEASIQDIERLVTLLVSRRIPAVFIESTISEKSIRALIEGAAARGHSVSLGGSLFSDAMGAPDTYQGTYIGMIDHNVSTIASALGGTVPEGGMSGRLGRK